MFYLLPDCDSNPLTDQRAGTKRREISSHCAHPPRGLTINVQQLTTFSLVFAQDISKLPDVVTDTKGDDKC